MFDQYGWPQCQQTSDRTNQMREVAATRPGKVLVQLLTVAPVFHPVTARVQKVGLWMPGAWVFGCIMYTIRSLVLSCLSVATRD